jgi:predicted chitinase
MDYKQAKDIRKKSFGSLLAEQEGGLGTSLKKSISLKTQAKMTGIKETFDPMNIAKKLTGGSNWAPAMLGKLTGRDSKAMEYFAGAKPKKGGLKGLLSGGESDTSSPSELLGLIYEELKKADENKKLNLEEENNRKKEEDAEEDNRNAEIIKALTGRGKKAPTRKEKKAERRAEKKAEKKKVVEEKAPTKEAPKAPTKEAPKAPTKEAPKAPTKEAPKAPEKLPTKEAPKPSAKPSEAPAPKAPTPKVEAVAPKAPPVSTAAKVATGAAIVGAGAKGLVIAALISAGFPKEAQANILANVDEESRFKPRSEELGKYSAKTLFKLYGPPGVEGGQPANGKNKIRFQSMSDAQMIVSKGPEAIGDVIYGGRMGNNSPGDGFKYRGRGFIQITGKDMYKAVGDKIGVDLVSNPDLANEPSIAAKIVPAFFLLKLGKKKPEDLANIDEVNKMVGSASEASRNERKKLAAEYSKQDLGSQIDQSSKENKDLKESLNKDKPTVIQTTNNTSATQTTTQSSTQSKIDDRPAPIKKAQG